MLDNSSAIIFVKDLEGRYTLVNRRFSVLINDTTEILGKTDFDLFSDTQAAGSRDHDRRVLEAESVVEAEEVFQLADGPHTFLSIRFPLRDTQDHIYAIAGIATDITDRKNAENEAREALTRRDQFLAMLSHELRNPLAAILNATQVLERQANDLEHSGEAREVIQRQVGQMARLLDDLLDVTRIAQNRIRLQESVLDLREIVTDAIGVVKSNYQSAGVELIVSALAEPAWVFGDAARLQQMLINLLLNASKYTPAGGKVSLTVTRDGDWLVIAVKDTGVGIRPEMLDKVFDLFVQANETLDRSDGGMGVGLTLVRTIVSMHGGTVSAASDGPGKGSEFVVRLPLSSEEPAKPSAPVPLPANPVTVLVVEDNADSRRMLEAILSLDGYQVRTASDGKEGLAAILEHRPRVAIIDIGLPGLDGYQIAREVRAACSSDEVYLIALTGYGRPEDRRAVREAGFDEHLVKPLKPDELAHVLSKIEDTEKRNSSSV